VTIRRFLWSLVDPARTTLEERLAASRCGVGYIRPPDAINSCLLTFGISLCESAALAGREISGGGP
jgi:hypothetical protein